MGVETLYSVIISDTGIYFSFCHRYRIICCRKIALLIIRMAFKRTNNPHHFFKLTSIRFRVAFCYFFPFFLPNKSPRLVKSFLMMMPMP